MTPRSSTADAFPRRTTPPRPGTWPRRAGCSASPTRRSTSGRARPVTMGSMSGKPSIVRGLGDRERLREAGGVPAGTFCRLRPALCRRRRRSFSKSKSRAIRAGIWPLCTWSPHKLGERTMWLLACRRAGGCSLCSAHAPRTPRRMRRPGARHGIAVAGRTPGERGLARAGGLTEGSGLALRSRQTVVKMNHYE